MDLGEIEDRHQAVLRLRGIVTGANQFDDFVDVDDGHEQAVHQVQSVSGLLPTEFTATTNDLASMGDELLQHVPQSQGLRLAIDESDRVDRDAVFEGGHPKELLQHRFGSNSALELDDQSKTGFSICQVDDVGYAGQLLGLH